MSYQAVRVLIEDTIKSIDDSIRFAHARASDFNSIGIKEDKRVHLDSMKESLEYTDGSYNLSKTFNVFLTFYKLDSLQGAEKETTDILDEMDILSDKFINKLNMFSFDEDTTDAISTQNTEIKNISKNPVIKVTTDYVTGFILNFNFVVPDAFDYCSLYD